MRTLVVYYSRDGHTRKIAEEISRNLKCDTEELIDTVKRSGLLGWIRSGMDASRGKLTKLQPIKKDPAGYDLVVIGTPVWARKMSTPVRTYLVENKARFKNVAFFCTEGSTGSEQTFAGMEEVCGKKPKSTLEITTEDLNKKMYLDKVTLFATELEA